MSRILFCDSNLRAKLHYAHIDAIELGCIDCSYELIEEPSAKAIVQELVEDSECFYLTDPAGLLHAVTKLGHKPNARTILMVTDKDNTILTPIASVIGDIRFLLGAPSPGLLRGMMASILEFGLSGEIRGIVPRVIKPDPLNSLRLSMTDSSTRPKMQEKVIEFFADQLQTFKGNFATGITSFPKYMGDVVDEFLMNAIWDAHPDRRLMDRSVPPALDEGEVVDLECLCDGAHLSLSVTDHHGTFPASAFGNPIRYALGFKEEPQLNEGPGGAGLGLLMTLQKVAALSIEVEAGKITRSVALLRGDQSLRDMQRKPRTVMIFEKR